MSDEEGNILQERLEPSIAGSRVMSDPLQRHRGTYVFCG